MSRPDFVTNEDIIRWSAQIDSEEEMKIMADIDVIREVCYAGLWLVEELKKLDCPEEKIVRIQFTAGQLSYGKDTWDVHQMILDRYKNGDLTYSEDLN